MSVALVSFAIVVFTFTMGAAFGVWLDNTQRAKPIDIGVGRVIVATTSDPTEICLIDPYKRHAHGVLGETRKVDLSSDKCGVLLARIRIADPEGAWVFQRAFERAVEAAKAQNEQSEEAA